MIVLQTLVSWNNYNMVVERIRRRRWHPTPVLLPGKSHGWRSLVGYSPWGRWGSDTAERLHFPFSLSCIGEGNGNPLQYSCLENPRDGGAWWAAVYGVAQSRTQLQWLSSSSGHEGWSISCWVRVHDATAQPYSPGNDQGLQVPISVLFTFLLFLFALDFPSCQWAILSFLTSCFFSVVYALMISLPI